MTTAAPHDLKPGEQVGEYEIVGVLGRGGFAAVYEGVQPVIGKRVAVKVLHAKHSSEDGVARFVHEARAVNKIAHDNIVDVFSFGQLPDGRHFFVMDLLRGMTLDRLIAERGRLPLVDALPILRGIALALDAAHARNIAHRDLKPENVFVAIDDGGGTDPQCPKTCLAPARVATGIVALYTFTEGSGTTVLDRSGVGTALDLTIGAPQNAAWLPGGGLSVTGPAQIHTAGPATKILNSCKTANALTVEAWVASANHTDLNRSVVALSASPTDRAFRIIHEARSFGMDVRASNSNPDGTPELRATTVNSGVLMDVAYMLSGGPQERLFIDAAELELSPATGRASNFTPWPANAALWVGDEPGGTNSDFHGVVRLVAIYCRPLTTNEVVTNWFAGP